MLRRIKNFIHKKTLTVTSADVNKLHEEVSKDIPIELAQIASWFFNYRREKKPLLHPYVQLAQLYMSVSQHARANDFYERYLEIQLDKNVHALYLQNHLLSDAATNQSLLALHQDWHHAYTQKIYAANQHRHHQPLTANGKIKIGYLCHFFTNSVSHNVFLPMLKLHDRSKFEIYCYDDGESAEEYKQLADKWQDIRGLSDKEVAHLIAKDGIHILQELNGFCIINRFGALAYRPAPIQINWYNHTSTTGLPFVDYVMSDVISIPDADLPYLVEKAYRHFEFIAAVHFDAKRFGEIVQQAPVCQRSTLTFGYFGGSHKITPTSIATWCAVLKQVPHARLLLKCAAFSHPMHQKLFLRYFEAHGIHPNRIMFEGWSDQQATLQKYNDIDLMLDNIPVSGGSTMFEALMQGVPMVTLMGERWAARSGASVLTTLKHPELIAYSIDEYIRLTVALANNPAALNAYRQTLRTEMQQSPLTNIQTFYHNFETAYLTMWQQYVSHSEHLLRDNKQ